MIERFREWNNAAHALKIESRLESHYSAEGRRFADRSRGIGTDRRISQPRCNCARGPTRRSSRNALDVPRIVHLAKAADHRAAAIGEFVQVLLADKDSPGRFEPLHDLRALCRNTMLI